MMFYKCFLCANPDKLLSFHSMKDTPNCRTLPYKIFSHNYPAPANNAVNPLKYLSGDN